MRRQHADAEQQQPRQRRRAGGGRHREIRLPRPSPCLRDRPARQPSQQHAAAQQQFVPGEQRAGQEQRDDVVIETEHHDRGDDARRRQIGRQAEQHRAVEHPEAARHVGRQPRRVGGDVNAEEDQPGQPRRMRHQHPEDRRGQRHIRRGQRHLRQRHAKSRQLDLVPERADGADPARERHVADDDPPQQDAEPVHHGRRQVLAEERDRVRLDEQDRPAQHHAAEAEGQAAERHHPGNLPRRQPPMRIEPIAHRRAGDGGEPQVVRQRVGTERREGDPPVADLVPGVDGAEPVIQREPGIGEHGEQERQQQRPRRNPVERLADGIQPERPELPLHGIQRPEQQHRPQERRHMPQAVGHRGVRKEGQGALPPGPPPRAQPLEPSGGFARKGAQLCCSSGPCSAPFLAKPSEEFQGTCPLAGGSRGAKPSWPYLPSPSCRIRRPGKRGFDQGDGFGDAVERDEPAEAGAFLLAEQHLVAGSRTTRAVRRSRGACRSRTPRSGSPRRPCRAPCLSASRPGPPARRVRSRPAGGSASPGGRSRGSRRSRGRRAVPATASSSGLASGA